jgi:2-dehydropantoate 2-reductase
MNTQVEFAILGAGALGTILGAHLVRAGHSVAVLARGRRAAQIQADGLTLMGLAELTVPVSVVTEPAKFQGADVLIVATKAISTSAALAPLRHAAIGATFSIQNGVMKNELLGATFGKAHVLGALANMSGELFPTGEALFTRNVNLLIGELDDRLSERAKSIASRIDASGVRATAVAGIRSQEWSKFAAWVALAALSATTRSSTGHFLSDAGAALIAVRVVREIQHLARAVGVDLTDEAFFPVATLSRGTEASAIEIVRGLGANFLRDSPQHRMSTLQDLDAHRPLEVEETLGFAVRKAAELRLSVPLLETFYHLLGALDRAQGDSPR